MAMATLPLSSVHPGPRMALAAHEHLTKWVVVRIGAATFRSASIVAFLATEEGMAMAVPTEEEDKEDEDGVAMAVPTEEGMAMAVPTEEEEEMDEDEDEQNNDKRRRKEKRETTRRRRRAD